MVGYYTHEVIIVYGLIYKNKLGCVHKIRECASPTLK
jgi:hypothetical protein